MAASIKSFTPREDFEVLPAKEAGIRSETDVMMDKGEITIDDTTALHRGLRSRHLTMIGE